MHRPHNVLVERREERVVVDGREVLDDRSTYRQCDGSEDHRQHRWIRVGVGLSRCAVCGWGWDLWANNEFPCPGRRSSL